jgi:hypothetical protein
VERVKQCGRRTVITTSGIIYDTGPNGTLGEASNDTQGAVLFTIGDRWTFPGLVDTWRSRWT